MHEGERDCVFPCDSSVIILHCTKTCMGEFFLVAYTMEAGIAVG